MWAITSYVKVMLQNDMDNCRMHCSLLYNNGLYDLSIQIKYMYDNMFIVCKQRYNLCMYIFTLNTPGSACLWQALNLRHSYWLCSTAFRVICQDVLVPERYLKLCLVIILLSQLSCIFVCLYIRLPKVYQLLFFSQIGLFMPSTLYGYITHIHCLDFF